MITRDDLRAATGAGILTEAQAARLATLASHRMNAREAARAGEEPFELFRGFNEIFIVVGLGILGLGWFGVWALIAGTSNNFQLIWSIAGVATAFVILLLSEYFIRRRRMVAPAIALSTAFALNAGGFWLLSWRSFTVLGGLDWSLAGVPLALTTATILIYWGRYRVPFAMALIGASAFAVLIVTLGQASGRAADLSEIFLLSGSGPFAWGTLLFGLALFALAMRFDMSDPHRMTLRAANGFWLHVIAAPAIVNTLALTLVTNGTAPALVALTAFLVGIALVAVVIDRRSFLISAVGYTVALVAQVSEGASGGAVAVLILGAGLVGLGAGWQTVRAGLMRGVPARLRDRLPPSA